MSGLKFDTSQLENALEKMSPTSPTMRDVLNVYTNTAAKDFESYAKQNRIWTDRTGDARKRLKGTVSENAKGYRITLSHGVDYGVWLELANEKKYAILEPTIRLKSNDVLKGFNTLMKKLGGRL